LIGFRGKQFARRARVLRFGLEQLKPAPLIAKAIRISRRSGQLRFARVFSGGGGQNGAAPPQKAPPGPVMRCKPGLEQRNRGMT